MAATEAVSGAVAVGTAGTVGTGATTSCGAAGSTTAGAVWAGAPPRRISTTVTLARIPTTTPADSPMITTIGATGRGAAAGTAGRRTDDPFPGRGLPRGAGSLPAFATP